MAIVRKVIFNQKCFNKIHVYSCSDGYSNGDVIGFFISLPENNRHPGKSFSFCVTYIVAFALFNNPFL